MNVRAGDLNATVDGQPQRLGSWEGRSAAEIARDWQLPAIELLRSVGSTNDVARSLASMGAPEGTVVLADQQTAGRGRSGRAWSSPAGLGLYLSFVVRPRAERAATYPLSVAIAVAGALDPWTGGELYVKWPNDLLLGGRKLGGILCEAAWTGGTPGHLVAGIGLNVLHRPDDFPRELRSSAASLHSLRPSIARYDVATAVVRAIIRLIRGGGPSPGDEQWRAEIDRRDALAGRSIDILEPESGRLIMSAIADGIGDDGSLQVRRGNERLAIRSGTIRLADAYPV